MNVFIVGPGGVGKSTSGTVLADLLKFKFVDIDNIFCDRIESIQTYINKHGYIAYCRTNSLMVQEMLCDQSDLVYAMPSGFLVHEECPDVALANRNMLTKYGVAILLLPCKDIQIAADIVVSRQMQRGFELLEQSERRKYQSRHCAYLEHCNVRVFGIGTPVEIATQMKTKVDICRQAGKESTST